MSIIIEDSLRQDRRESQCKVKFFILFVADPVARPRGISSLSHLITYSYIIFELKPPEKPLRISWKGRPSQEQFIQYIASHRFPHQHRGLKSGDRPQLMRALQAMNLKRQYEQRLFFFERSYFDAVWRLLFTTSTVPSCQNDEWSGLSQ